MSTEIQITQNNKVLQIMFLEAINIFKLLASHFQISHEYYT